LVEIVNYVIASLGQQAKQHSCAIARQETWPVQVFVHGERYRVQSALTCLLDNAIKYSYSGYRGGTGLLYEVRVYVETTKEHVKTTIRNYGIGIPEDKLEAIKGYGYRGEVVDKDRPRLGTGLGLSYSIEVFEGLGGWIHVTSVPAKGATEEERKNYHRYITTVEAGLPISRRD
jgi:signal transduction histidine kinase